MGEVPVFRLFFMVKDLVYNKVYKILKHNTATNKNTQKWPTKIYMADFPKKMDGFLIKCFIS